MQTVITRDSTAIPWGFRLKGGAEYNVPLSILKVNEGSPAYNRLEVGDVIATIGNYPALNLKHEEALNIIRMFDLTLPLTIQRQQSLFNPTRIATPKSTVSPVVWRPQSVSSYEPTTPTYKPPSPSFQSPTSPRQQSHFSFTPTQSYQPPQPQVYQTSYQAPQPQVYKPQPQVYQPTQPQVYHQPQAYQQQSYQPSFYPTSPPPTQSQPPIPPAPPLPDLSAPIQNFKQKQADASYRKPSDSSISNNPVVPDVLLNKVLGKSPMGQKPFSYTPGGLDLSHIRESARVKRYEQMSAHQEMTRSLRQGSVGPDFAPQYQQPRYPAPQVQNFNPPKPTQYQTYNPLFHTPTQPPAPFQLPQSPLNRSSSVSTENFAPMSPRQIRQTQKMQSPPNFNVTPDQLIRAKKENSGEKDMMNQSFSFRMLNKWIADSEANTPIQLVSKKDEEENNAPRQALLKKSEVIKALEEDENKMARLRNSQSPQSAKILPNQAVPSKVFQYVDRKFSESSEQHEVQNTYNRLPAREREQEAPAPKYKGNHIPSKTFKYLQYITQNESETTTTNNASTSEPFIQTPQVQVATSNRQTQQMQQMQYSQQLQQNSQQIQQTQQSQQQVSQETSYVKQQAKQHSFIQQEAAKKNSNSVSFPAYITPEPALASNITNSKSESLELQESVRVNSEPLKPDLVLSSTREELIVENLVEQSAYEPENEPNALEQSSEAVIEEPVIEKSEPVLQENIVDEPLVETIPESLSITNNEVINTDIILNQADSTSQFLNENLEEPVQAVQESLQTEQNTDNEQKENLTHEEDLIKAVVQEVIETSEF